jgi:hypothetical protein
MARGSLWPEGNGQMRLDADQPSFRDDRDIGVVRWSASAEVRGLGDTGFIDEIGTIQIKET